MIIYDKIEAGKRLIELQEKLKVNSRQFAIAINADPSYVSKMEKGEKGISKTNLKKIEDKYNVNIQWLLFGKESMFKQKENGQNVPHGTTAHNTVVSERNELYGSDLDRPLPIGDVNVTLRDYIDLLKRVAETRLTGIEVSLETLLDRQKTNIALVKTVLQRDVESKAGGDLKKKLAESHKIDKLTAANREKDSHVGIGVDGMDKKGKD